MTERNRGKLNRLERDLPEGLLVDASWLAKQGYSTSLRSQYVAAGWLAQPAHRVYWRARGKPTWQQVVVSLQALLGQALVVGGRTALELQGYAHYVGPGSKKIHVYGPSVPPTWINTLTLEEEFVYHNSVTLFGHDLNDSLFPGLHSPPESSELESRRQHAGVHTVPFGQWNWPMVISSPERAFLEALQELPHRETFHQVDMLMEGLSDLRPRRLQDLLGRCRSVKVKRLFFFFADRHSYAWLKRIDRSKISLGTGKRMLVPGGRFDPTYQITVPEDFHGIR